MFPQWVCLFCWRKYVDRSWDYINRSQTHECGNWGWGRAIPKKGIDKWDFRCSAVSFIDTFSPASTTPATLLSPGVTDTGKLTVCDWKSLPSSVMPSSLSPVLLTAVNNNKSSLAPSIFSIESEIRDPRHPASGTFWWKKFIVKVLAILYDRLIKINDIVLQLSRQILPPLNYITDARLFTLYVK